MKIRLGITVPLLLEDELYARLLLPHFNKRNFGIPQDVTHSIWLEAKTLVYTLANGFTSEQRSANVFTVRGQIQEAQLLRPETSFGFSRSPAVSRIWTKDPFQTGGFTVQQSIEEHLPSHLRRIVLVVDTSRAMSEWEHAIEEAIKSLPPQFEVQLVLTDAAELSEGSLSHNPTVSGLDEIATTLRNTTFTGGADNVPALGKAWELAAEKPGNNVIVWIHAPQLLELQSADALRQRWERRPYGPLLYSVSITSGSDELEKKFDGINEVKSVPRMDRLQQDLENLFARLTGQAKTLEFIRVRKKLDREPSSSEAFETSDHLARLWANDEVMRILTARDEEYNKAAAMLAVQYQLVTPVTGAVVLETAAQYSAAGLQPVEPGTVPTIPEPGMVVLLIVAGAFMIWVFYMKYRHANRNGHIV